MTHDFGFTDHLDDPRQVLSVERRVTSTSMSVSPLMVPAKTFGLHPLHLACCVRVRHQEQVACPRGRSHRLPGAWLILEEPTTTKPSAGRRSLGRTMTTSPGTSSSTGISTVPFALRTIAVSWVRAWTGLPRQHLGPPHRVAFKECPRLNRNSSRAPSAQAPMLAAPTAARSISESISKRF